MTHTVCYGNMFPSVIKPTTGKSILGKALSIHLERAGGMAIASHRVDADAAAWDECTQCHAFEDCYKLSMAKLSLETGILQSTW